jgi:thioredoxin 2
MTQSIQAVCAECGGINRFPAAKLTLAAAAKCGKCGHLLFPAQAEQVSEDRFTRIIANSDIPILVDFWAPWCGPCRALAPVIEHVAQAISPNVKVAKVNVDEAQTLANRLGIRSIPTLAIFQGGKELARTAGVMDQKTLIDWTSQTLGVPIGAESF